MSANGIAGPHGFDGGVAPFAVASPARTASDPLPTFGEVLRALNPLQYLPVVGTIYRVLTGDQGSPAVRTAVSVVGGAMLGGPFGLLASMAGAWVERMFHLEAAAHTMVAGSDAAPDVAREVTAALPPQAVVTRAIGAYSLSQRLAGIG